MVKREQNDNRLFFKSTQQKQVLKQGKKAGISTGFFIYKIF
jgi:hypothetical protein